LAWAGWIANHFHAVSSRAIAFAAHRSGGDRYGSNKNDRNFIGGTRALVSADIRSGYRHQGAEEGRSGTNILFRPRGRRRHSERLQFPRHLAVGPRPERLRLCRAALQRHERDPALRRSLGLEHTAPTGEFDIYGGVRLTFGQFAFDFGGIYYWYPNETQIFYADPLLLSVSPTNFGFGQFTVKDTDFWEVYGKLTWTPIDWLAIGPYVYYSPNWLGTGAPGTYAGSTVKAAMPSAWFPSDWGAYVSGEAAHYWLGTFSAFGVPFDLPDYTYWNIGAGITYKIFTLDFRYHDTDLSQQQCFLLTGDPSGVATGQSKWCNATFIAKFSFDLTAMTNLK